MGSGKTLMRLAMVTLCGLALTAGWQFFDQTIAPLEQQEEVALREATDFKGRIDAALRMIAETWVLEQGSGGIRSDLRSLHADESSSSALVWFPDRMEKHFARWGVAGAVSRLNSSLTEPDLAGFERTYWAVELAVKNSTRDIREAFLAITEIEPVDPAIRVLDVAVRADANDPARRLVVMNAMILSRKAEAAR